MSYFWIFSQLRSGLCVQEEHFFWKVNRKISVRPESKTRDFSDNYQQSELIALFLLTFRKKCFSLTLKPLSQLEENPKLWHYYNRKKLVMPFLVEAVKNDIFPLPMTTGSENLDFLWPQFLPEAQPVLWVPQSCLKVLWLGRNLRCPVSGNF